MRFAWILILIAGLLITTGCSSPYDNRRGFPNRDGMPNWENIPDRDRMNRNFTFDNESINQVTDFFENAQSQEEVSEYRAEHMMECGYYCREINPDNELCSFLPQRNRPPGNWTRPEFE
ncbi:hypothetical protein AYK26_02495 [Euryarchaeota archaeon SM23-78]|nr:MAG: hypothetical protein AYK26_02495 [Euryarchaeota archaeon SM23-78]MBW3000242.1 hypothetical protein [Candidatus Woesearchaeota archaeon]